MAGNYNGHILEFPLIRVDCFTSPPPASSSSRWLLPHHSDPSAPLTPAPNAQLFLLTHVHSDHLIGLSDSFTGKIVCTPDTKRMLLRLEAELQREYMHDGVREGKGKRKYAGLKPRTEVDPNGKKRIVDLIAGFLPLWGQAWLTIQEAVPYGDPRVYDLGYDENNRSIRVTITVLDANHCPGSSMFLIESDKHAVLHTGDIRADSPFLEALRNNPAVGQYIERWPSLGVPAGNGTGRRRLNRIYLDTSAVLGTCDMPDRDPVLKDLIQHMSLYPDDTVFFLNVWCFGWEHVVKEVARHFGAPVHVDRYKASIYSAVKTDHFLAACTTSDPMATRFHACERRFRCEACRTFNKRGEREWNADKRVITVNMVEIKTANWDIERNEFLNALGAAAVGEGPWPYTINCPIARHSTLPELQRLVKLFRPDSISPNTMVPDARGMDFYLLPDFFADCLGPNGVDTLTRERDDWFARQPRFGKSWLQNVESAQHQAHILLDQLPEATSDKAKRAGRRANAQDQINRLSGISGSQVLQLVAATNASPDMLASMMMGAGGLATSEPFQGWDRQIEADYDTDDEDDRRKKRRKASRIAESDLPSKSVVEVKAAVKQEETEPTLGSIQHENPTRTMSAKAERMHSEADEKPRSFHLDRQHLRALMTGPSSMDGLE